ncbi:hypothetical protein [Paenibacillus durus]|uniref:Uncharacterized protein n=1 Tax=Paenibacillus durus ATCC 35681 TaxID=1333534 RepID=A0A0F7F7L0_PAEDU|nr:hypothetical protein [Paenibacillus durus]AKG33363.1 hypothetical protein VK70_01015 [Paenibacillus durus ATCC 35681]
MEFQYNVVSYGTINVWYNYGGETFKFNLFKTDGSWLLHPFEGILISNRDLYTLVLKELLQNKYFQVMLAKEGIHLSALKTTIDIGRTDEDNYRENREADFTINNLQSLTLEEIIEMEISDILNKISIYKRILERMFMDGIDHNDFEFQKVKQFVTIYEETLRGFEDLSGPRFDFNRLPKF